MEIPIRYSPLRFSGTPDRPVVLKGASGSWAGILALRARAWSHWRWTRVEGTTGVQIEGLGLTGGVTFFESPFAASAVRFVGSEAEDMLNVFRGEVELSQVEFAGGSSDAVDGDFVSGSIRDSVFHDIHGDGIDVSGSRLEIERVTALRLGDKAVSAGEASTVHVRDLTAEDVGIGIAAKDSSRVTAERVTVRGARTTAFAAYQKKPEYGPGTLLVSAAVTSGPKPATLADLGSRIEIDGQPAPGTALDVKHLRQDH